MSNGTVERQITENNQEFAELMAQVATLPPQKQEHLTFYIQGYTAGFGERKQEKKRSN